MNQQNREYGAEINLHDIWMTMVKRKRLIIGIFVVSVILTTIISFLLPRIYRGETVLRILPSEAKELIDIIGNIDRKKMQMILPSMYHSITNIKLNTLKDSKDKIRVIIEAKKIEDISQALPELVNYINNIDFMKMNLQMEQERLAKRSAELSSIIVSSSDLLNTSKLLLKDGKPIIGFNLEALNKEIVNIKIEQINIEQSIQRLKRGGIETMIQIYIFDDPVKPKIKSNVVLAGAASLFMGIFLTFFLEYMETNKKNQGSNK